LAQTGEIELHLVTESPAIRESQTIEHEGFQVHVLKGGIPFIHRGFPPWLPLNVLTRFYFEIRRICKRVRAIQPAIVHAHGTEGAYGLAGAATGLPCLVSMQGIVNKIYPYQPCLRFWLVRRYETAVVRRLQYFTCRTEFDTGFVRAHNPQARIFQIHEAIRPIFFQRQWQPRAEDTVLYVGSLETRKGLPMLLEAFRELTQRRPTARLTVIGGGNRTPHERRCREWGLREQVRFLGFQSAEEIAAEHCRAQVFVLPSENENSPNALAEAMVTGLPVIATAVGGVPSLVENGQTGFLIPPRDPQALCQAMLRLLGDIALRERLSVNARRVARERHDPSRVAAQTLAAYHEVLAATARNREERWPPDLKPGASLW